MHSMKSLAFFAAVLAALLFVARADPPYLANKGDVYADVNQASNGFWYEFELLPHNAKSLNLSMPVIAAQARALAEKYFTENSTFVTIPNPLHPYVPTGLDQLTSGFVFIATRAHNGEIHGRSPPLIECESALRCNLFQGVLAYINGFNGRLLFPENDAMVFVRNTITEPFKILSIVKEIYGATQISEAVGVWPPITIKSF